MTTNDKIKLLFEFGEANLTRIFHRNAGFWGNISEQFVRFAEKHSRSYGYRGIVENGR